MEWSRNSFRIRGLWTQREGKTSHLHDIFEQVMRAIKAKYVSGLTATPTRKDGHHPLIQMQYGSIRFGMTAKAMTEASPFQHRVLPRLTTFQMQTGTADATIQDIYRALAQNETRNELIVSDVRSALRDGRSPLLLTGRTDHLMHLADLLEHFPK